MESDKSQKDERVIKRYQKVEICFAITIALLLHMILVSVWIYYEGKAEPWAYAQQQPTWVRMVPVTKKPKARPELVPDKQVVSTIRPEEEERPKDADYVSEFDQKVHEQTKSFKVGPDPQKTHHLKTSEGIKQKGPNRLIPEQRAGPSMQNPNLSKTEKRSSELSTDKNDVLKQNSLTSKQEKKRGKFLDKPAGGENLVNMMPSVQDLERYNNSAFNDHLENVEEDTETRLNTFQWKHATYFNRIKETVGHVWSPDRQIQRYDPQGAMLGQRDRYTVVAVSLDREGQVVDVNVKTESGVDYLDEEAVRTFKTAGPFPNPPQAVFGEGSTFTFAFGFYVSFEKGFFGDFGW